MVTTDTRVKLDPTAEKKREELHHAIWRQVTPQWGADEIETHFATMPARYWSRVDESALAWHLSAVHDFFLNVTRSDREGTEPVIRWRHQPERGTTEVLVCTWDRLGLLSKVAGALAEVRINILRADIYTRADDVVLDVFYVCNEQGEYVSDEPRLDHMARLLTRFLSPHRPITLATEMPPLPVSNVGADGEAPEVNIDNEVSAEYTAVEVVAADRIGLLYYIFRVLSHCRVNIAQAVITTEDGRAGDVFFVTDEDGRKITDPGRLADLRARLLSVLR
jgi:[protein-PII] uridylyltransferase